MLAASFQQIEFVVDIKVTDGGAEKALKSILIQTAPAFSHCFLRERHAHNSA
jgi:hypothetical protein